MDRIDGLSLNLEKNNIDKIKELFPEAVEEGKINFDMLRAMLGDEVDDSKEKYQFTWNGKAKSIKLAQTPSSATLRPCKDKSEYWDTTENLYIEGDNLEVLKQLQKTYYGKIKMIYIDPPYNTGNDFVYNDSFTNSIENYKEQTNQTSSSNPESNGRFHTDWLNMMYPRLILAKNLLKNDGCIFVSIDDNENTNLSNVLNEVFGENNKIAELIVIRAEGGGMAKQVVKGHEYLYAYAKDISKFTPLGRPKDIRGKVIEKDGETFWIQEDWLRKEFGKYGNCHYEEIEQYKGLEKKIEIDEGIKNGKYVLIPKPNGMNIVGKLRNVNEDASKFYSILKHLSAEGIKDLETLNLSKYFSYPKPINLLTELILGATFFTKKSNDIILDFFSGSATTGHAVFKQNAIDKGNRKFIMVQLPEIINENSDAWKDGYRNLCDIGEERLRRAGKQVKADWEKEHNLDGLFCSDEQFTTDIGFKVFKLDSTNVNEWDSNMKLDEKELAMRLGEVFKEGRSKEDILYEIMLKYGVFDKQAEEIDVNGKIMYRVGKRYMIVCLNDHITSEDVKAIGELFPKTVIFNEAGFNNDNDKINAVYNLEKCGVEDVKCI